MSNGNKGTGTDMECITFGTLRKFLSRIDRLSICREETLEYENFIFLSDVPESYDQLYVYGIGMVESEFFKDGESRYLATGDLDKLELLPCIEIMLSEKPREFENRE